MLKQFIIEEYVRWDDGFSCPVAQKPYAGVIVASSFVEACKLKIKDANNFVKVKKNSYSDMQYGSGYAKVLNILNGKRAIVAFDCTITCSSRSILLR